MNSREKSFLLQKYKFLKSRPFTSQEFNPFLQIISIAKHKDTTSRENLNNHPSSQIFQPNNTSGDLFHKEKAIGKPSPQILHYKSRSLADTISTIPSQTQRILMRNQQSLSKIVYRKEVYSMKTQQLKFRVCFDSRDSGRIHDQGEKKGGLFLSKIKSFRKKKMSMDRNDTEGKEACPI